MTLQRATQYALIGLWLNLLVSLFQSVILNWEPNFYYQNLAIMRILMVLGNVLASVPLIIFFSALRKGQSRQ